MTAYIGLHLVRPREILLRDQLWLLGAVALAYYIGAEAAFAIGTLSDKIFAPFWPPNIVLFCALMLMPYERWWIVMLVAFPPHALAELRIGMGMPQMLVAFATNCLVAGVNALAVRTLVRSPPWFGDLGKTSRYILITALAGPALCALGGAFVPILGGGSPADYWSFWAQWYGANALASVTLGPIALIATSEDLRSWFTVPWRRQAEAAVLVLLLIVFCTFAFRSTAGRGANVLVPVLLYAPLAIIVWSAERFGAKGASSAILVVTIVLIWRALADPSLFSAGDPETNVFALQVFLIGLAVPVLLLGSSIDQARTAEQSIRASEERMAFAATSANIGLWHYDIPTKSLWASDHCRAMFGISRPATVTPDVLIDLIHPDERAAVIQAWQSAILSGQPLAVEFHVVPPTGEPRWMQARGRAHYRDAGKPVQVSGIFIDVSALKAAEADAELQRKELAHLTRVSTLGELSGAIAHELHQPLTAILSNAQAIQNMLHHDPHNLAEVREALDDIVQEGNRAGEVIHRMRRLLKKDESRLEEVDLNELVRSTLRLLHSELVSRRVRVKLQLTEGLSSPNCDPVQLQQVLINLVMNAIDAVSTLTPDRRVITIRRSEFANKAELSVVDRGSGISAENQAALFRPFASSKKHGLGLGLSICSTIVRAHGGELTLTNNKDSGATATVRLPLAPAQRREALHERAESDDHGKVLSLHRG